EILTVYYMCGLDEAAAEQAARELGLPPSYLNEETAFDNPSWGLYRYWLRDGKTIRSAKTSADLHEALRELGFRKEVLPLADDFSEAALSHLDVQSWARRLAYKVYHEAAQIPPMPQARF
ncbi:hypothetical protein C8T65DRAFT_591994, partial [Cerioporus squamosus]